MAIRILRLDVVYELIVQSGLCKHFCKHFISFCRYQQVRCHWKLRRSSLLSNCGRRNPRLVRPKTSKVLWRVLRYSRLPRKKTRLLINDISKFYLVLHGRILFLKQNDTMIIDCGQSVWILYVYFSKAMLFPKIFNSFEFMDLLKTEMIGDPVVLPLWQLGNHFEVKRVPNRSLHDVTETLLPKWFCYCDKKVVLNRTFFIFRFYIC